MGGIMPHPKVQKLLNNQEVAKRRRLAEARLVAKYLPNPYSERCWIAEKR
jgi:hypothetical protein